MSKQTVRRLASVLASVANVLAIVVVCNGCASVKKTAGDKAALYMVIDLSGGTNALIYPVTYYASSNEIPGGVNSDPYKTTNILMRLIPAGVFVMGSPLHELGRDDNETQYRVTLTKDFYMGVFEITQQQWELVMGTRPSCFTNAMYDQTRPVECVSFYEIRENPCPVSEEDCKRGAISRNWPVTNAVHEFSFMGRLCAKTGLLTFDLPTEAQWEYACRAGTMTALNSGKNLTNAVADANMAEVGRYEFNGGSGSIRNSAATEGTAKVGSFLPNAWGLYDMHGNVCEWCLERYTKNPFDVTTESYPGVDRVFRGGSWYYYAGNCRSAFRYANNLFYRDSAIGFRVAMPLPSGHRGVHADGNVSRLITQERER